MTKFQQYFPIKKLNWNKWPVQHLLSVKWRGRRGESYHDGIWHTDTQTPICWGSHGTKLAVHWHRTGWKIWARIFFVAAFVCMKYCKDEVLNWSCDYVQIWRAFQFFLVVFDNRVELINISSTRVLKNIPRGPHVCTDNTSAWRLWKVLNYMYCCSSTRFQDMTSHYRVPRLYSDTPTR